MTVTVTTIYPPTTSFQSGQEYNLRFNNNRFLTAHTNGTFRFDAAKAHDNEKFRFNSEPNGTWSLRTHHGKVLCYDQGKSAFETRDGAGDWERFEFRPAGNGSFHMYCPAQRIYINFMNDNSARPAQEEKHASHIHIMPASVSSNPNANNNISSSGSAQFNMTPQFTINQSNTSGAFSSTSLQSGQEYNIRLPNNMFFGADRFHGSFKFDVHRATDDEKFRFNSEPNGTWSLKTHHGKVVCFDQGKARFETRDSAGDWERFEFRDAGRGAYHMFCPAQRIFIHFENNSARAVQDAHQASGIYITPATSNHHGSAFVAQPIQGFMRQGFYNIRNHHNKFIEATRDKFNQTIIAGSNEKFFVEQLQGGLYAIRAPSQNNRVMCVGSGSAVEYRDSPGPWESFEIRAVQGRPHLFNIYCPAQRKFLRFESRPFEPLTVCDSPGDCEQFEFLPTN
eukprot:GILI01018495.1.p1 GENE.GILI01018495.1~~GILI01018495.1.p1  ORF type:complete len:472 (-),score=122.98 GILI01018495.1:219-1571(-)